MTSRSLACCILGLWSVLGAVGDLRAQTEPGKRPNVVLVMTDDQGYGDIRAHGNSMIRTPNLDSLHGQSVRLTDFHVDPTCSPTRSALMSGRYSTRTGVWHTILGRSLMDGSERTVAEALRPAGYRTGMFGKWHLGENYPLRPQDQGFDDVVCHGGGGVSQGPDWWGNDYFDDTYWRNGKPEKFKGYCTDVWFREAMRFIETSKDRPFFCYLSTNAPHSPLFVDEKWSRPYIEKGVAENQAKFYGMVENIDWNLGRLMAQLDRLGIAENTILVFMTDNGTAAGRVDKKRVQQGKWGGFNAGMRGNKGSEYDGGHRVPCFVRWPAVGIGGAGKGRDEGYLSAHFDVLPTLTSLCGVRPPPLAGKPLDGASLAARLRDPKAVMPDRTLFVHSQRILHPKKWRKCAVMTERWRLVGGKELYDVIADPGQAKDVAAQQPEVVARLTKAYDGWWDSLAPAIASNVRIAIGSPKEPTTLLHAHDWQRVGGGGCPWHQLHVKRGLKLHGQWFLDVQAKGIYEFELRRWVRHLDKPIEAKEVRLIFPEEQHSTTLFPGVTHATLRVALEAGPTTVQSILTLPDGTTRGAYYVYVTLVKPHKEPRPRRNPKRPNLVFLLTDDQNFDSLGCYGNRDVKTPNIDALAQAGMAFDRHYVTTAICMASRATILTGMYEFKHGCNFNHGALLKEHWRKSYPVLLRSAGYRTAIAGKIGITVTDEPGGKGVLPESDFDVWGAGPGQTSYQTAKSKSMASYAAEFPHSTRAYGAFGRDFIASAAKVGQPFCLSISFKAPHRPTTPDPVFDAVYAEKTFRKPDNFGREHGWHFSKQSRQGRQYKRFHSWGYADRFDEVMAIYHQQVHAIDVAVGMIRQALVDHGVADDTVVVFTSDNGFFCGAHGYGSKVLPYEESARVPLIIHDPRHENSGKKLRCGALTGSVDFAPTLLRLAGVESPTACDGRDLMVLYANPERSIHDALPLINAWGPTPTHCLAVVTRDSKYVYWPFAEEGLTPTEELYDLAADPLELKQLSDEPSRKVLLAAMQEHYDRFVDQWKAERVPYHRYARFGAFFDR